MTVGQGQGPFRFKKYPRRSEIHRKNGDLTGICKKSETKSADYCHTCRDQDHQYGKKPRNREKGRKQMFDVSPQVVAVSIPIVFVLGAIAVSITAMLLDSSRKDREHKERMLAMEKGIELPEKPAKSSPPRYLAMRAWGLVFTFIGLALVAAITMEDSIQHGLWGLLPMSIGVALLVAAYMEKKENS